jgi:thymidine phosphorylase
MVSLGNQCGVNTRALLTNMDTPLGRAAGNWLEVKESFECLEVRGPNDLRELVVACAAALLEQTGRCKDSTAAIQMAEDCLNSGKPRQKWDEMLAAQGADLTATKNKLALGHTAPAVLELKAPGSGFVTSCDARIFGEVIRDLGGGRLTKEASILYDVGVDAIAKLGESRSKGEVLARIHATDAEQAQTAAARLQQAFTMSAQPPALQPRVVECI